MNANNIKHLAFSSERQPRTLLFTILGDPIPLQRPRLTAGHVWDSQKHQKLVVSLALQKQFKDIGEHEQLFHGPLFVDYTFFMPIPVKTTDTKRKALAGKPCTVRKDLDNLVKFYADVSANGVLYLDDCVITEFHARKLFDDGNGPRTIMILTELL